jgi:predicted metal-dependent phosphoesterase TrpH
MDLHVHSCLSPCGDPRSVPTRIVAAALKKQLDAIAVCDHNASENVFPIQEAAQDSGLVVFGGMEITSREEIHVLAIFGSIEGLCAMQEVVYSHLPGRYEGKHFGEQYIVDREDYVTGYNDHLLMGAAELSVNELVGEIHRCGGLAVPAHVDREAFSIVSQLGFIPPDLDVDALEVSFRHREGQSVLDTGSFPVITSSDAHEPEEIGRVSTEYYISAPTVEEVRLALRGEQGRDMRR